MKLKLSKIQLDNLSTILGFWAALSGILVQYDWISSRVGGTVGAICVAALGFLTNKPATASPTTSDLERKR